MSPQQDDPQAQDPAPQPTVDDKAAAVAALGISDIVPGNQLYDSIMQAIEPELTTTQLPALEQKYNQETPEQAALRAKRYSLAFEDYDKQFLGYAKGMQAKLQGFKRESMKSLEHIDVQVEQEELSDLEIQMQNTTAEHTPAQ